MPLAAIVFSLALGSTFFIDDSWISNLVGGLKRFFGVPLEPLVLLGGNALLVVHWFWRYRLAVQAVRWGNF